MESLNEQESMRVLQAAAAMDAARAAGARHGTLTTSWPPAGPHQLQQQLPATSDGPNSPNQGIGEDVWREMAETDGGEQMRHGDLDSWLDVFRATAASVRNAWRPKECLTFEALGFGWLALARKHEPLQCAPAAACGEELTDMSPALHWLSEAQWAQAAYQATSEERLQQLLGLQPADLLAHQSESSGWRPAFFLAVHHESRTVRLVVRGTGLLRELLTNVAGHSSPFGAGFAHHGMLSAAQQLLAEESGRLRGALEAHPGYGLHLIGHSVGAGTAALLAVILSTDVERARELGSPAAVRATCFATPPVVTAEVAEQCASYVDSVVYNADLVSRCSAMSLRRLADEMSAASEEVLARSELAQALRRSGALGLANHLVAAALCRCQPPQEGTPAVGIARPAAAEGLALVNGTLGRSPTTAAITSPTQPNGRVAQLAGLGSQHKVVGPSAGAEASPPAKAAGTANNSSQPPSPSPAGPVGPPSGSLPPLVTAGSAAGSGATRNGHDTPPRRNGDVQGVLSPPPLVAAAAAAHAQTAAAAAAVAATGPTPPRRGLMVSLGDQKTAVGQQDGRAAAGSTGSAANGDDGSGGGGYRSCPEGGATPVGAVLLEPLQAPPLLPSSNAVTGVASLPGQRRDVVAAEGIGVAGAPLPLLLPPMLLPPVVGAPASQPQSPRPSRQASMLDLPDLALQPLPELQAERSLRNISQLSPSDVASQKHMQQLLRGALEADPAAAAATTPSSPPYECHELLVPGCVYVMERRGADANSSFRLLRDVGRTQLNRILLKRSMLRDHLLSHYLGALERVVQYQQQAGSTPESPAA